jgi:tRNA-specific 2-thiouridylase
LASRIPLHPGRVVDVGGAVVGRVDALELVTVGQRRGLSGGGGTRRYAVAVDTVAGTVVVGGAADLLVDTVALTDLCWVGDPLAGPVEVEVQTSAHGEPMAASYADGMVSFGAPQRRVAPGQSVVLYRGDEVLGGGIAARS